jgi:hypothetical protein
MDFETSPEDRAKLRWVMRAAGEKEFAALFVHPHPPNMVTFSCTDGVRVHQWRSKDLHMHPELPILGLSLALAKLEGHEGVDRVSMTPNPGPVVTVTKAIGTAEAALSACKVADMAAFRKVVVETLLHVSTANKRRAVVIDLHNGLIAVPEGTTGQFVVAEADGAQMTALVDTHNLKAACPEGKKGALWLYLSSRTLMLRTLDQVAVLALLLREEDVVPNAG